MFFLLGKSIQIKFHLLHTLMTQEKYRHKSLSILWDLFVISQCFSMVTIKVIFEVCTEIDFLILLFPCQQLLKSQIFMFLW